MVARRTPFVPEPLVRWTVRICLALSCILILLTALIFARGIHRADEVRHLVSDYHDAEWEGMFSGKYAAVEFVRGIENGIRTETWPNGWKRVYPDGEWWKGNTRVRVYDPKGTLRRESALVLGETDGPTTLWNESGRLLGRGHMVGHRAVGVWFMWNRSFVPYAVVL
jgi:hypothetical protein